jgi:acyl transferase domain-containing protein
MAMRAWPEGPATPKAIASLRKDAPDSRQILEGLAQLYVAGARPNFRAIDDHLSRRKIDLPTYPFQRKTYWFSETRTPVPMFRPGEEDFDWSSLAAVTNGTAENGLSADKARTKAPEPDAWLVAAEAGDREAQMIAFLSRELGSAFGVEPVDLDIDAHFVTLGMDSLMATDLRARLQVALNIAIPSTALISDFPDVRSLAGGLLAIWTEARLEPVGTSAGASGLVSSGGGTPLSHATE